MPKVDGENATIEFEILEDKGDGDIVCEYKVTDTKDPAKTFQVQHFGFNLPDFNDPVVQKQLLDNQFPIDPCAPAIEAAVKAALSEVK